nr:protein FdrA [Candidatus Dormibacteraeota bacterium]
MTTRLIRSKRGTYVDSVRIMSATRKMLDAPGVEWAAAVMATPASLKELTRRGFALGGELDGAHANDLIFAVEALDTSRAEAALTSAEDLLPAIDGPAATDPLRPASARRPRTLRDALATLPGANLALISVPGPYAALEAHKALSAGLHVLLFSD